MSAANFDSDGAGYIAIFAGQAAELRARDYYDAIERGALNTRIADAQIVTPKTAVSFPRHLATASIRISSTMVSGFSSGREPSVWIVPP